MLRHIDYLVLAHFILFLSMSSIVTSILSTTIGLLWNKVRDTTAGKLKHGDVTGARIREILVRELNDIKTKLDGLSRKDLLSSYRFLKEGVDLLSVTLDKANDKQIAVLNESQDDRGEPARMPSGGEACILNEALELSHAMGKLKISSDKEFESAKKRFEEARKRATDAFCNESLTIKDRIFAAKLRIVSEILEYLDSPQTAITGCVSFLQELQSLPAVREIFSVYLKRGVKSQFNKAERVEHVKSVMVIHYVLFQFVSKFNTKYSFLLAWPTIELADRSFHPILHWQEVSARTSWGDELLEPPNKLILNEEIDPFLSAVNGHGEIIARYNDSIKVISKTDEIKVITLPEPREGEVSQLHQYIAELAVDKNNNVYLVRWLKTTTENGEMDSYVLYVLDENYDVKHSYTFDLLDVTVHNWMRIAVNNNSNIIMIKKDDPHVYVCENTGQLKCKLELDSTWAPILCVSNKNEIMIRSTASDARAVHTYTEEGAKKSTIIVPEGHDVRGVAFQYLNCKIIVLTKDTRQKSLFLLCYSDAGELEGTTFFCNWSESQWEPRITSHPSGPVAVVNGRSIIFI